MFSSSKRITSDRKEIGKQVRKKKNCLLSFLVQTEMGIKPIAYLSVADVQRLSVVFLIIEKNQKNIS